MSALLDRSLGRQMIPKYGMRLDGHQLHSPRAGYVCLGLAEPQMLLAWILGFSLLGSLGAVGGAALLLAFPDDVRKRLVPALVAYAAGTLLGAAFLGMIPAAAADTPVRAVSAAVLAGIVLFFVLERLVLWRHGHEAGGSPNPAAGNH